MEFVDRIDEQRRLHQALHGENPSGLVVVYGRRRLGKSTLIKRVFQEDDVYFMADNFVLETTCHGWCHSECILASRRD